MTAFGQHGGNRRTNDMDGVAGTGTVAFTQMKDGTRDDYMLLRETEHRHLAGTADRLLREMALQGDESMEGYKISRLGHALQSATRAWREGADEDWIVSALLHDIGDGLAPQNHDRFAAEILRPYVRDECVWVVEHHGAFQMIYYAHHYEGWDPNERDRYSGHPYFDSCAAFCERWDQSSFDPDYETRALEDFAPMVRAVFARHPYDPAVIRTGVVLGLPA
jgi:predicted HD phosphohydrolase